MDKKQDNISIPQNNVGITETKYFTFAEPPNELILDSSEKLSPITLAYETYGKLNKDKSNAILCEHALTGDAHVAGYHKGDKSPGWWDTMIGPGKAFDTNKYFVICSNVIGGCKGSTGPSSINPKTNKPYGLEFPVITIRDMVNAQRHLIDYLGIQKLLSVVGGSMGGMQALQWVVSYPDRVCSGIPIATTAKHSSQQIAFSEVERQAVMADPNWHDGNYYGDIGPSRGLAVARMIGHITYMSDASMAEKFGRRSKDEKNLFKFDPDFEVEGYLHHRGDSFVKRFDANSYLYITKALDYFDLAGDNELYEVFKNVKAELLIIAFKSDWLYPAYQSQEIVKACKLAGVDASYCEIESTYGHDAFLLEIDQETNLIKHFLEHACIACSGEKNGRK
ncbi:MAG: homoserine O-acetyltransferase [Elusimicrobia bacterium RIFOXYD2_FULL_34_15]|nr:MAG: homoserine O-acetyltransferase [Elusimicrobia bacterium RIFOXYD2_FULL_34_15]